MADDDWKKLSTEEKIEHKNWKARSEGYEECIKQFRFADDPKNPIYLNYLGLIKKFVVDTNEVAREKALDAVFAYVENIPAAAKTVGEVMPGLVNKCLNGRAKTKERAIEIIMMYIEVEKQDIVLEELLKGLDNKQPKVVQACCEVLRKAMHEFGSKTVPIKPIIKFVPKLLEDRDKIVRDEAKLMAVEMYHWAGAAIMPQFSNLKPVLMQELEEEFKKLSGADKARQTRFLRSQQDLKQKMEAELANANGANGGGGGDAGGDSGAVNGAEDNESVDPYDLMEPVDILTKLPKDFKEKLEAKKWQDRKEALEALQNLLTQHQRLVPTDYHDLITDLKKVIAKDANIVVATIAAKCVAGIAKGLRKEFGKYVLTLLEPILEKFKEKKQNVIETMREAIDAMMPSTNLDAISETCIQFLAHKTPCVRQQVALFLVRCFAMSTQTSLPKKTLKIYLTPLIKNLSEADPSVRESSAEAIGAAYKAVGEKAIVPLLGELEPAKLDKIKECADKIVLLNMKGEPRGGGATAKPVAAPPASAPAANDKKKPTIVKGPPGAADKGDAKKEASSSAPAGGKKDDPKKKVVKGGGGGVKKEPAEEPDMSPEAVDEKAGEIFGAEVLTALGNANWKDRLQATETITSKVKSLPSDEVPTQVIVRTIAKKPGLKDTHFQVLKQKLDLVSYLAAETKFTQRSAQYSLPDIADKIGDVKNSQSAKDALSQIAEAIGLQPVIQQTLSTLFEAKNPKNQEHAMLWSAQAIKEFGFASVDVKQLIAYIKSALQNSNAAVRSSGIQLIGTLYLYMGSNIRVLFESEKAALLEQIDAEIEKSKGQTAPAPIRGKKRNAANGGGASAAGGDEEEEQQQQPEVDLLPRNDISGQITEELITQLNDKNWKERQAALEKLEGILKENKFIVANLGELPAHLSKRLTDSNKILATTSLKICEKLAESMGANGKKYCSALAGGMIQALSDNKEALRKQAVSALNAWFTHCGGLNGFLENEVLVESFATTNPNLKSELCGWLSQVLPKSKKLPPELKAIIPPIFACIEDRNPDVRSQAQLVIEPLMQHVGPNDMLRVMQKLKPASVTVIQPLLEKARADLAAKQPAAPPPQAPPQSAPAIKKPADSKASSKPGSSMAPSKSTDTISSKVSNEDDDEPTDKKAAQQKNTKTTGKKKPDPKAATNARKKNGDDEDLSPPIVVSNKNKRMEEEKALKTLKWNFDVPRREFVDQLKFQFEPCVNRTLLTQLFHDDFKHHINALSTLLKCIEDSPDAIISNCDLILRWLTLRFFETNPTVIVKAIEFMQALFNLLSSKQHTLIDFEAAAFIPYFINKLGDPKDPIRKGFRQIVKQISQVYPPVKVFNFLIGGLTSKNARQRAECLEEMGQMIEAVGLNPFNPAVTLKEIAKQIGDRDTSVRNAALNTITSAYQIAGDHVFKYVGKLNDKDQSMLDERIKRSAKAAGPTINKTQTMQPVNGSSVAQSQSHSSISSMVNGNSANPTPLPNEEEHHSQATEPTTKSSKRQSTAGHRDPSNHNLRESRVSSTPKQPLQRAQTQTIIPVTKKGEFTLDLKDDDDEPGRVVAPIKSEPHKDLDELLYKPIGLPARKNVTTAYPVNILKESQDCKEAIDLVITHISHQQMDISFQNLLQIDVVIKDREKKGLLQCHIDNLLNTCAVKLNVVHNVYLNSTDYKIDECFKLLKGLFTVMLNVFEYDLGKYCNVKTLKDVLFNLLSFMIDSKINNLPEGDQLIKAINMVTLKVLELSEQTSSFCALVKLLTDSCNNENLSNKFLELVMKCIWRQIRRLSTTDSLISQINTSKVLAEIHTFLKLFPSNSWQSKVSDLPLRTIKTLLYHLAKARDKKIIEDLELIERPEESEIKSYVMKLFKNGFQLTSGNVPGSINSSLQTPSSLRSPSQIPTSSNKSPAANSPLSQEKAQQITDQLATIFKKITSTNQSKQGLEDLYDFKINYPDIDLSKYMKNSSESLQKYLEEGLQKVAQERREKENLENHSTSNGNGYHSSNIPSINLFTSSNALSSNSTNVNVEEIMKSIADWKSKTNLNKIGSNDEDLNLKLRKEPDNSIKADKYLDIVRDLKKKYTRARTEAEQDIKDLDSKVGKTIGGQSPSNLGVQQSAASTSNSNLTVGNDSSAKLSTENLYDEYRRRLELIKKVKPIK